MTARIPQSVREEQLNALPGKRFVRWADKYVNCDSKAVMICGDGHQWEARVTDLIDKNRGCAKCSKKHVYSIAEREQQLNALPTGRFVRWEDSYKNNNSKAIMRCELGHEWSATMMSLVNQRRGCPKCAKNYSHSAQEREAQLNALPNIRFVRWLDGYRNSRSKAIVRCHLGHEWSASVNNLVNHRHGCPKCAHFGYDPSKPGALYVLRHEDGGHVKVGITNDYPRRITELRRRTPFEFAAIALHHSDDGYAIRDLEKTIHSQFESAGLVGFDGATEWLKFNPGILTIMRMLGA